MRYKSLLLVLACAFVIAFAVEIVSADTLYENYTQFNNPVGPSAPNWRGQTIRIGTTGANSSFPVGTIALYLDKVADGNLTVVFKPVNSTGGLNATNLSIGSIMGSAIGAAGWYNITMSTTAIAQPGQSYAIMAFTNQTGFASIRPYYQDTAANYTGGNFTQSGDGGQTFSFGPEDLAFKLYSIEQTSTTLLSPSNNSNIVSTNVVFNASMMVETGGLVNTTLYVWRNDGSIFKRQTAIINGTSNTSSIGFNFTTIGRYNWNYLTCSNLTNFNCTFAPSNFTFNWGYNFTSVDFNSGSYETANENFGVNVSLASGFSLANAALFYNNVEYAGTVSNPSAGIATATRRIDIPLGAATYNLFWRLRLNDGTEINTTTYTQGISVMNLSICTAAPLNTPYVNFTFKNETTLQQNVNASIISSWSYWMGSGAINKTYSFTNSSTNSVYSFCFNPQNRTVYAQPSIQYQNAESPLRTYSPPALALTNSTTPITLYLLPTSQGQFVTFQVVGAASQNIIGAQININRTSFGSVESRVTDASGAATFFLDPTVAYNIQVNASGFDLYSTTITPTQSSYTISLGGDSTVAANNYNRGMSYTMNPNLVELNNGTVYTFNFTISSAYWTLDSFGFTLQNASGYVFTSATGLGATGGTVSTSLNTGNNQSIIMNAFWVVNGTYSNVTKYWVVVNSNQTSWSISNFFTDLNLYLNDPNDPDGLFGLKNSQGSNFGLAIIIFFTIFMFAGVMSYKYGLTSTGAITFLIFAGVMFFDVGVGIVPNPVGAVQNFPTIFMALVTVAVFMKEAME